MMRPRIDGISVVLFLLFIGVSCTNTPTPTTISVNGVKALERVQAIVDIGPKPSNSANAKRTAEYLKAQCLNWVDDVTLESWTEDADSGSMTFHNVYATLPGKGKTVVLGTHFDTKELKGVPNFQGANDGGSSTGLALEILSTLHAQGRWRGPTIVFAFFDGEECLHSYQGKNDGLHGSKRMIEWLKRKDLLETVDAMVLLDMIGDKDLKLTISPDDDSDLRRKLSTAAKELGVSHIVGKSSGSITDDHVPFKRQGIPAIDLIDFDFGPNNSYWHTDEDTMDKINAKSLQIVGDVTIRLLQLISWK